MFGFQGGERPDILTRKKEHRKDAQERWTFLTHFELSTIKNEDQLGTMVKERSGISEAQAKKDVHAWMQGRQF